MQDYVWGFLNKSEIKNKEDIIKVVLKNRQIDDVSKFLNPKTPSEFIKSDKEMIALIKEHVIPAKKLILEAIKKGQEIVIHGDYDVDGQTATAILWKTIYEDLGYKNVRPFIPNRFDDGYGLSMKSLSAMRVAPAGAGAALIITVDCGIVSNIEVEEAKKLGFTVIITDHHESHKKLPKADEIIHTTNATGAGISWILSNELSPETSTKKLGLAALGTICDLQPLTGFNRSIAKHGLEQLNSNMPIGINALSQTAFIKGKIGEYEAGWQIGPRLNATGRMEDAMDSLLLLSTNSMEQAMILSKKLNSLNLQRQDKTISDTITAVREIENENADGAIKDFIVTSSKNYHEGIIGLVAGKLTQKYNKPAIAIAINESEDLAKGSARSIAGISIIDALRKFDELFEGLGGHEMAAGFSIKPSNIPLLKKRLYQLNEWPSEVFKKSLKIDAILNSDLITIGSLNEINNLKPFGVGNYEPIFCSKNIIIANFSRFGKENDHLKLFLKDEYNNEFTGLAFGKGNLAESLENGKTVDIAFTLSQNTWNEKTTIEIKIKDLKESNLDTKLYNN